MLAGEIWTVISDVHLPSTRSVAGWGRTASADNRVWGGGARADWADA